jgi:hypothetical protein
MRQARQVSNPEKDTNAPIPVEAAKRRDFKSTLINATAKSLRSALVVVYCCCFGGWEDRRGSASLCPVLIR